MTTFTIPVLFMFADLGRNRLLSFAVFVMNTVLYKGPTFLTLWQISVLTSFMALSENTQPQVCR